MLGGGRGTMLGVGDDVSVASSYSELSEGEARRRARTLIRSTQTGISSLTTSANARTTGLQWALHQAERVARQATRRGAARGTGQTDTAALERARRIMQRVPKEVQQLDFVATLAELRAEVAASKDESRYDIARAGAASGGKGGGKKKGGGGGGATELQFGVGMEGTVAVGAWAYFTFELDEPVETRVVLRAVSGNSDLYVSTATSRPGPQDFTWRSCRVGTDFVVIRPEDPAAVEGQYYVGVYGDRGQTSRAPTVSFYVSVTKSKEVTNTRRISTAERLLQKQGYKYDAQGLGELSDRVAAAQWRRRQARTTGKDFIKRNAVRARTAPRIKRPGRDKARVTFGSVTGGGAATFGSARGPVFGSSHSLTTGSGSGYGSRPTFGSLPQHSMSMGSLSGGGSRRSAPIVKVRDSRTTPGHYSGTSHDDRSQFVAAPTDRAALEQPVPLTGKERWASLFGAIQPSGSDMAEDLKRARQRREQERLSQQADRHAEALRRAGSLTAPAFPSFSSWSLVTPAQPAAAATADDDEQDSFILPPRRRTTPRSVMKVVPPELLAAEEMRRPCAPVSALGFETNSTAQVKDVGDVAKATELPPLPDAVPTYLDEHRNNQVVVPLHPHQLVPVGQRGKGFAYKPPPKTLAGPVSIVSKRPNASLGPVFGVHPVINLSEGNAHVRLPPMVFGGSNFTIEVWINCKFTGSRNARILEFGSQELEYFQIGPDGEVDAESTVMEEWAGPNGDPPAPPVKAAKPKESAADEAGSALGEAAGGSVAPSGESADGGSATGAAETSRRNSGASHPKLAQLIVDGGDVPPSPLRTPGLRSRAGTPRTPSIRASGAATPVTGSADSLEGRDGTCTLRLDRTSGKLTWAVRQGGEWYQITCHTAIPQDRWVHVAVVGRETQAEIYMDGYLDVRGLVPLPEKLVRLRHFLGVSTWDTGARPFRGLLYGLRIWGAARSHLQLRATKHADLACEDDSLGLGLSLKESEFVRDMVKIAEDHATLPAEMEGALQDGTNGTDAGTAGARSVGGSSSGLGTRRSSTNRSSAKPSPLPGHHGSGAAAGPAVAPTLHPKYSSLAAIATLFRVEPKHIKYPLRLDPGLRCHFPMTEGANTSAFDVVRRNGPQRFAVLYGASWSLNLETKADRAKVISVAARFDTLLRQFDRLQQTTRRNVVQGFLSIARMHNIPVKRPQRKKSPEPFASGKIKGMSKGWMKSLRVVRAASALGANSGPGFMFNDKQDTHVWVEVLRDGFFHTREESKSDDEDEGKEARDIKTMSGSLRNLFGDPTHDATAEKRTAHELQRRALRVRCSEEWIDESLPLTRAGAIFFLVTAPASADRQLRIDLRYRGMSSLAGKGATSTYLDRGCVTLMAGVGPFAPEPQRHLWGMVVGNRRAGDLDGLVGGNTLNVADDSSRHLVLSKGAAGGVSHYIYVAVVSGDVLTDGKPDPALLARAKEMTREHEVSIRISSHLAPAAAARLVRRFDASRHRAGAGDGEAATSPIHMDGAGSNTSSPPPRGKGKRRGQESLIVGPDFEFDGLTDERMKFDRITLSLRGTMHERASKRASRSGTGRRGRPKPPRVPLSRRGGKGSGHRESKRCNLTCGSHSHHLL